MRFATALIEGRQAVVLVDADGQRAWPVGSLQPDLEPAVASDMMAFVTAFPVLPPFITPTSGGSSVGELTLLAPFPRPARDVICVGKNYREHAREFTASGFDSSAASVAEAIPDAPIIFVKSSGSVVGPRQPILLHPGFDRQMDYEAELGVVIGKAGRRIARENALDHVFGYTIINDVTARDLQAKHKQWFIGKSLDGSCPMGPWLVTADEIDLASTRVECRVNGELRQSASTGQMIFDVPCLIETISACSTLEPGDIIATGTPAGVALSFDPPRYLGDGDVVEITIDGIGTLTNKVRRLDAEEVAVPPTGVALRDQSRSAAAATGRGI